MTKNLVYLGLLWMHSVAAEWSGFIAAESRYFPHDPLQTESYQGFNLALRLQPEFHYQWDDGYQTFSFVPFLVLDQHDPERTHADIRELTWVKAAQDWELRLGLRKLFWGVTESQHLVDIINQTDLVENPDGEDKLGQPMINLAWIQDWGTLDGFILPGFRPRTFASRQGRLYLPIAQDRARYESAAGRHHVDWALRWSRIWGNFDIGLSHFVGTSREPRLLPAQPMRLIPYYEQIQQTGLDVQATQAAWLWKLEWISRDGQADERFSAFTGGFEYTFVGVWDTTTDVGVLSEYAFDERQAQATTLFDNDLMFGVRILLNDIQSSELLMGLIVDLDNQGRFFNLEASRRLADSWKLSAQARIYANMPQGEWGYALHQEDYIQLSLAWYF